MKYLLVASLLVLTAAFGTGCQSQERTTGLDEGIYQPPEEERQGPLEALAFWNWGQEEEEEPEVIQYQEEEEEGFLDALAFWNWGDDEEEVITDDDVLSDMSPEMTTRARTSGEVRIDTARTLDTNGRTAWDDLRSLLLLDRPSHLSLYPTP